MVVNQLWHSNSKWFNWQRKNVYSQRIVRLISILVTFCGRKILRWIVMNSGLGIPSEHDNSSNHSRKKRCGPRSRKATGIILAPVMYYRVSLLLLNNVMISDSLPRNLHFLWCYFASISRWIILGRLDRPCNLIILSAITLNHFEIIVRNWRNLHQVILRHSKEILYLRG